MRVARGAAFVAAVLGVAIGLLFVLAPLNSYCQMTITGGPAAGATPGPTICGQQALWQAQPIFPMPFFAILVWSLAPLVSYVGVRRRLDHVPAGSALIFLGLVLESTVLISFGAAPMFAPFVLLPLVIAVVLAFTAPRMG